MTPPEPRATMSCIIQSWRAGTYLLLVALESTATIWAIEETRWNTKSVSLNLPWDRASKDWMRLFLVESAS